MTDQLSANPRPVDAAPAGLSRRRFLTSVLALGGGLVVAVSLPGAAEAAGPRAAARGAAGLAPTAVGAWVQIGADSSVTVLIGSSEMGQGISTGLAQIVAEELKVPWTSVAAAEAPAAAAYANPLFGSQTTGGSSSVRGYYQALRVAGASARQMLVAAAAQTFGVAASSCTAANGVVTAPGGHSATYGQLASLAATMTPPTNPTLTDPSAFTIIGTSAPRVDIPLKVTGKAIYGIDVTVRGMVYAAIKHCPAIGGTLAATPAVPAGALAVVPLGDAVAVVASSTWQAIKLARSLKVTWKAPKNAAQMSNASVLATATTLMASGTPLVAEQVGAAPAAIAASPTQISATYQVPYLPHACMEVLNATANVTATSCEIWAPTQGQSAAQASAAAITGLPTSAVTVNTTFLGGGLGRKFENDFISQAVTVSKAIGKPVKLTWSREEDFGHDQYRPFALVTINAGLDATGNVTGFHDRIVTPSILGQRGWLGPGQVDSQAVDGAVGQSYTFGSRLVEWVAHPSPIPVGFWRSVGNSFNAFAVESAIDELAHAAGVDPVTFRLRLLGSDPRSAAVLTAVAAQAGWSTPPAAGTARGVALHAAFGSIVAQVATVSSPAAGQIHIEHVDCVIDCGTVINPNQVSAQMEGGIMHGLNAALLGNLTFSGGVVQQVNFDQYKMLRMKQVPSVAVSIIPSTQPPGGVGEPGVPPIAPAVANAYFALTGTRLRTLPLGLTVV